jgi:hypothetical protein
MMSQLSDVQKLVFCLSSFLSSSSHKSLLHISKIQKMTAYVWRRAFLSLISKTRTCELHVWRPDDSSNFSTVASCGERQTPFKLASSVLMRHLRSFYLTPNYSNKRLMC